MTKKFTLTAISTNGGTNIKSENDGYTALELVGLFVYKINDIFKQMNGEEKPEIKRTAIEREDSNG